MAKKRLQETPNRAFMLSIKNREKGGHDSYSDRCSKRRSAARESDPKLNPLIWAAERSRVLAGVRGRRRKREGCFFSLLLVQCALLGLGWVWVLL